MRWNFPIGAVAGLVLAMAAVLAQAVSATARANPCLSLATIVSGYHNTSSHHGQTANQLFADIGQLTLLARFGQAASHVQLHEPVGTGLNVVSPNGDAAYAELSARIRWLDAADLNPYSGVSLSPIINEGSPFCTRGLLGGTYVRENAGALLGRVSDALFLAFRATNDGWNLTDAPVTPDAYDWTHLDQHYGRYQFLLAAIDGYLAAHPEITRVYLAGDSLGGAMVQRYLQLHPGNSRLKGFTFGSPGTPSISFEDDRLWTFITDIDPLILVPNLFYRTSGKRFIVHIGVAPSTPPNAVYHAPQAYYRIMQHLDRHGIGRAYLNAKFAGGSITRWNSLSLRLRRTATSPEDFTAGIPGTQVSLPGSHPRTMAGGDGSDRLIGGIGAGDLFGFDGSDCLEGLHRPEKLYGGAGPDVFLLHGNYLAYGGDVMDFRSGRDRLAMLSTLPAFTPVIDGRNFVRGTTSTGIRPTLLYDRAAGRMWYDFDGRGPFPALEVARFAGHPAIAASDIVLTVPALCR
jgi:hypothetical protein